MDEQGGEPAAAPGARPFHAATCVLWGAALTNGEDGERTPVHQLAGLAQPGEPIQSSVTYVSGVKVSINLHRGARQMRMVFRAVSTVALMGLSLIHARALRAQGAPEPTDGQQSGTLFEELVRMDSILFDASFATCDAAKANAIFADDVEFYHDETGLASGEQVRENTRRLTASCPGDRGITRTVVPGSLRVYPIENYGAVQVGVHRFDERGAATSTLTRFVHVWHLQDGEWRLARVLSLDHHAVPALPLAR